MSRNLLLQGNLPTSFCSASCGLPLPSRPPFGVCDASRIPRARADEQIDWQRIADVVLAREAHPLCCGSICGPSCFGDPQETANSARIGSLSWHLDYDFKHSQEKPESFSPIPFHSSTSPPPCFDWAVIVGLVGWRYVANGTNR
jgi:hypothetical protein